MNNTLSERAVLTSLHIGAWSGRAHDPDVTQEVSDSHKADAKDAGRYSKQLVASRFLKHVGSVINEARTAHKVLTLPWNDDGTRILSTTGYQDYTERMRLLRLKFEGAVSEFAAMMPEYIKEAESRLGTMFDPEDYPTEESVKAKFWFDVEINKVPEAGDFRAKLSDATVKAIVKDIEKRADQRVETAMKDVWQRIYDVSQKMAERLKEYQPKAGDQKSQGTFRDSLVYNVMELANNLDSLNITEDQQLRDLKKRLMDELVEHSPEILRADPAARSQTMRKAEAIAKKAKSFLG